MKVYVVTDYDGAIEAIYDEEMFKIAYKQYIGSMLGYREHFWHRNYNVSRWEVNSDAFDNSEYVHAETYMKSIGEL